MERGNENTRHFGASTRAWFQPFQAAAARAQANGPKVLVHDHYWEEFDLLPVAGEIPQETPLLPVIARRLAVIAGADGRIAVHPNRRATRPPF